MRKGLSIALALCAALLLVVTLTAPMIAAAGPAILTALAAAAAYIAWPKRRAAPEPPAPVA